MNSCARVWRGLNDSCSKHPYSTIYTSQTQIHRNAPWVLLFFFFFWFQLICSSPSHKLFRGIKKNGLRAHFFSISISNCICKRGNPNPSKKMMHYPWKKRARAHHFKQGLCPWDLIVSLPYFIPSTIPPFRHHPYFTLLHPFQSKPFVSENCLWNKQEKLNAKRIYRRPHGTSLSRKKRKSSLSPQLKRTRVKRRG